MVEILMITHDRLGYTKKAVEALLNQTYENFKLTIWDNASKDGTQEYLKNLNDKRLNIIFSETNVRLADVVSEVFLSSDADLVGKVDNDTLIPENWLERLVDAQTRFHFGFIGGFHFREEDIKGLTPLITKSNKIDIWRKPYIGGCAFLIHREDFNKPIEVKGRDQRIFMGLSDYQIEFSKRGLINGYLWNPILWVDHMEDTRSENFIGDTEHQNYKVSMRGVSLEQNTEENYKHAQNYLGLNTL